MSWLHRGIFLDLPNSGEPSKAVGSGGMPPAAQAQLIRPAQPL